MNTVSKYRRNGSDRDLLLNQNVATHISCTETVAHPIEALCDGDEAAFSALMTLYYSAMLRTALIYVNDPCIAEDVIQETWIAVLCGLSRFEGRSSLKTWIFSILTKRAITRAHREGRYVQMSALTDGENDEFEPAFSSVHFNKFAHSAAAFYSQVDSYANAWDVIPEDSLLAQETLAYIHVAIQQLPMLQQQVIHLRDVEGLRASEVCCTLGISEINQRVLLHRARARVRQIVGHYLCID